MVTKEKPCNVFVIKHVFKAIILCKCNQSDRKVKVKTKVTWSQPRPFVLNDFWKSETMRWRVRNWVCPCCYRLKGSMTKVSSAVFSRASTDRQKDIHSSDQFIIRTPAQPQGEHANSTHTDAKVKFGCPFWSEQDTLDCSPSLSATHSQAVPVMLK